MNCQCHGALDVGSWKMTICSNHAQLSGTLSACAGGPGRVLLPEPTGARAWAFAHRMVAFTPMVRGAAQRSQSTVKLWLRQSNRLHAASLASADSRRCESGSYIGHLRRRRSARIGETHLKCLLPGRCCLVTSAVPSFSFRCARVSSVSTFLQCGDNCRTSLGLAFCRDSAGQWWNPIRRTKLIVRTGPPTNLSAIGRNCLSAPNRQSRN